MYKLIALTKYGPLVARYSSIQGLQRLALAWESESFLIMSGAYIAYTQGV